MLSCEKEQEDCTHWRTVATLPRPSLHPTCCPLCFILTYRDSARGHWTLVTQAVAGRAAKSKPLLTASHKWSVKRGAYSTYTKKRAWIKWAVQCEFAKSRRPTASSMALRNCACVSSIRLGPVSWDLKHHGLPKYGYNAGKDLQRPFLQKPKCSMYKVSLRNMYPIKFLWIDQYRNKYHS